MNLVHLVAVVSLLSAAACSKEDAPPAPAAEPSAAETNAAQEPAAAPEPAASPEPKPAAKTGGEVELSLSGALEAKLQGAGATCGQVVYEGKPITTVKVDGRALGAEGDWSLSLIVSSEEEWTAPSVMLNVRGDERASYTYNKKVPSGESVSVERDLSGANIDLSLKEVAGKGRVKVTGTLRCPAA